MFRSAHADGLRLPGTVIQDEREVHLHDDLSSSAVSRKLLDPQ